MLLVAAGSAQNVATVAQTTTSQTAAADQSGSGLTAVINQQPGMGNTAHVNQADSMNTLTITQTSPAP